jgi:hypothetical protein
MEGQVLRSYLGAVKNGILQRTGVSCCFHHGTVLNRGSIVYLMFAADGCVLGRLLSVRLGFVTSPWGLPEEGSF